MPLIIDEVQYAPILFEVIEEIVNRKRLEGENANGMFLLTGSQAFQMMKNVTQSLAGRASIIRMEPLSLNEILGRESLPFIPTKDRVELHNSNHMDVNQIFEYITKGMYPELYKDDRVIPDYYENYVQTYIDRDVSKLINIREKMKFHDFLQYTASMTGQQLNASDLARRLGVSQPTILNWLSILEATGLIYFSQPYSDLSITKRVVKSKKIYFSDTSLAAYLAKLNNSEVLKISNFSDAFNETFINNKIPFPGYYYRDNKQNEIDLILLFEGQLSLIEIKQGVQFHMNDVKGFKCLEKSMYNIANRVIVCNTLDNYPLNREVEVVSLTCI